MCSLRAKELIRMRNSWKMRKNLDTKQIWKRTQTNEKKLENKKKQGKLKGSKTGENLETKQVGRRTAAKAVMKCLLHLVTV